MDKNVFQELHKNVFKELRYEYRLSVVTVKSSLTGTVFFKLFCGFGVSKLKRKPYLSEKVLNVLQNPKLTQVVFDQKIFIFRLTGLIVKKNTFLQEFC